MGRRTHRASRLALALSTVVAGQIIPAAQAAGEVYDRAAAVAAICRGYAAAQHALPYDTMYAQCHVCQRLCRARLLAIARLAGLSRRVAGTRGDRGQPLNRLRQDFDLPCLTEHIEGTGKKRSGRGAIPMQAAPFHPT
jgi:hypothetical protein